MDNNLTEQLPQNIMLQFVLILFMEEYFSAYLLCIEALLHIKSYSEFQFAYMQKFAYMTWVLLRSASVHDLRTVSFSFPVTSFDAIF